MAWRESDPMKERVKFVLEWERRWDEGEGKTNIAELCREFGVSRQTGYVWIRRYRAAGNDVRAIAEQSRRPKTSPFAVADDVVDLLVMARKRYPKWGPKKLHSILVTRHPELHWPRPSTIGAVLKRRGLTRPIRRRPRHATPSTQPFAAVAGPNTTWCIDFKGHFRTADGKTCYPLTLLDAHTRYLLRCEVLTEPTTREVERVLDSAFLEFGLPEAIRSDNGSPFASTGAGGLTKLSAWLVKLGIRLERIEPGKPQQNGRLERLHRTLKDETALPPAKNSRLQQRASDLFRKNYNEDRPHEALGMQTPASLYEPSPRRYPRKLLDFHEVPPWNRAVVNRSGFIKWNRQRVFVSNALVNEVVTIIPIGETLEEVSFGPIVLGLIDEKRRERGLIMPRKKTRRVSAMSLD
jgi:transposase InsO family protein